MDRRTCAFTSRVLAIVGLTVVAAIVSPAAAQSPSNEIKLAWSPVPNATGYRIYYGTASLAYGDNVNAGAVTQAMVSVPTDGIPYHLAVKAYDPNGESMGWSREVVGWPRPEIGAIDVQCNVLAGGVQQCVGSVTGYNFSPAISGSISYSGVTVTGLTRADSRSLELTWELAATVQAGVADLVLQQPWTVTAGTQPPGDNGVTGGTAGPTFAGAVAVGTVQVLPPPQNVQFIND